MRRILTLIVISIILISLLGCQDKEQNVFNFTYSIKEDYREKVDEDLTSSLIDFTKDAVKVYETKFEKLSGMDTIGLATYMHETFNDYFLSRNWNMYEDLILDIMFEQMSAISDIGTLKADYDLGEERNYDAEFETLKEELKYTIEDAREYIE